MLINVQYSSLNYKDALSASGNKGVTRKYPHTPGIDAAGVVAESKSPEFKVGEQVLVTGYDLGMNTSGGYSKVCPGSCALGRQTTGEPNVTREHGLWDRRFYRSPVMFQID